jgi:hypothetical protein
MANLNISKNRIIRTDGSLDIKALQDIITKINDKINDNSFNDFYGKVLSVTTTKAVTNQKYSHGLNYTPNFGIITSINPGDTAVSLNFENFDNKDIDITTDGAVALKILIGRLDE